MLVLGISGGLDLTHEYRSYLCPQRAFHDSAAVLLHDGNIVAAIEEERLNRIKHTNKTPVSAIKFCLERFGVKLQEVDKVCVAGGEEFLNKYISRVDLGRIDAEPLKSLRGLFHETLARGLGENLEDEKLQFVPHHMAHAVSAYAVSGYDASLVVTADGGGDDDSGIVLDANQSSLQVLEKTSYQKSLGRFYSRVIEFLGFGRFEEYKVMGLAPYGNPERYRSLLKSFYALLPDGDYGFDFDVPRNLSVVGKPRKKSEPITQNHKDLAAALQEALEDIFFHVLNHFQKITKQSNLCLAGGVAHNCTLNGKILYSGKFENVFVQPASHDGGLALGAALMHVLLNRKTAGPKLSRLDHVYLGNDIGSPEEVARALSGWSRLVDFQRMEKVSECGAKLIAEGAVIGWVQGRSEFGPRALGNRSILADPQPAENKIIINRMVKKREEYRPFAPSVMEEYAGEFFELSEGRVQFPFMTFVVKVRKEKQGLLQAITHVDGTARIQTVSKSANPEFWNLIEAFRRITGVPMLLNTSFNNNVEPIVESVQDAVVCFLTTGLSHLVVGDYLVSKKQVNYRSYFDLKPSMPLYTRLVQTRKNASGFERATIYEVANTYSESVGVSVSEQVFKLLLDADGHMTVAEILTNQGVDQEQKQREIIDELLALWATRNVILAP